jgi:hypothetical protein
MPNDGDRHASAFTEPPARRAGAYAPLRLAGDLGSRLARRVFLTALEILVSVTTRRNRWQGGVRWQVTDA